MYFAVFSHFCSENTYCLQRRFYIAPYTKPRWFFLERQADFNSQKSGPVLLWIPSYRSEHHEFQSFLVLHSVTSFATYDLC